MRAHLTFSCEGSLLAATIDHAGGTAGLLIVSGGNEVRAGAHRGMAMLAAEIAAAGFPVLRFDRRGIGDSEGVNGGFTSSAPDIAAAVSAFRTAVPALTRIVAFGNCDAAAALLLHRNPGIDAQLLANVWTIDTAEPASEAARVDSGPPMPAAGAIRARYWARLKDPRSLVRLLRGEIDLGKLWRGLVRMRTPAPAGVLATRVADALAATDVPTHILLAERDNTAMAFADLWTSPACRAARANPHNCVHRIDTPSHSFAGTDNAAWLKDRIIAALRG